MKKTMLLVLLSVANFVFAQKEDASAKHAATITASSLKEKLTILASDEMEGRETATPGQKKAAAFIETAFKKMGLKPGNGTSYQQIYPVYRDTLTEMQVKVNGQQFAWDKDVAFSLRGLAFGTLNFNNNVFAGFGIVDSTNKMNDYTSLNVKGKLVVIVDGMPNGYIAPEGSGRRFYSPASITGKILAARKLGAAAVLVVTDRFPQTNLTNTLGDMYLKASSNTFFSATISPKVASALIGRTNALSFTQIKQVEKGNYISEVVLYAAKKTIQLESSNVIALLPGTEKKEEYVFITSHYDHLGKRGSVIYYGADDDGSGTTGVLQMAEAFAAAAKKGDRPKRNIVFMAVSGEEKGLWGSDYYSEHPIYPLDKTSVDLNTDMIGRVDTERKTADSLNYIYVIGHDKLSSELPIINESVNNQYTKLVLDYKYDDPADRNQIYYRSDHYNFAKKGVPVLFFYDGMLQADYHKPTDTVEKINFELMEKRTKLIFHTAWIMANQENMLKRDTPLNMPSSR